MSLLSLIIAIVVAGVVLWAVDRFIPMEGSTKLILKVVVIAVLAIWLLDGFGLLDALRQIRVGG